jgi:hypothetical protein
MGQLTGLRRTVEEGRTRDEQDRIQKDTYDPLGRNSEDIIRMLTFFAKAGGKSYTTLDNHQLSSLDLSELLDMNRAVLFGKMAVPTAAVEVDGAPVESDRNETYIRIVLPVKRAQSSIQAAVTEDR